MVFSLKPFPPRKKTNIQGRHGEFEPSAPLIKIGLTVTQNLGKAWALKALVVVAPLINTGEWKAENSEANFGLS